MLLDRKIYNAGKLTFKMDQENGWISFKTSKFAFVQLAKTANTAVASGFLEALVKQSRTGSTRC